MQCWNCGYENAANSTLCVRCGRRLTPPAPQGGQSAIPINPPPLQVTIPSVPPPSGQPAVPIPLPGSVPGYALPNHGSLAGVPGGGALAFCCVCGAMLYPGQRKCIRCSTPPGAIIDPNDTTATTYLPFGAAPPLKSILRAGASAPAQSEPHGGWNWGAALAPTLWAARERAWGIMSGSAFLSLLLATLFLLRAGMYRTPDSAGFVTGILVVLVFVFALPRSIYFGMRGSRIAWRSGRYADLPTLKKAQRSFVIWAIIGVITATAALGVLAVIRSAA